MKILISKERSRFRFYALFFLLLLLLFLDYALLLPIPPLIYVGILVGAAFLGDKDEILSVCICCIPLCTAIEWHYVVIFCVAIFVFKYGRNVRLDLGVIPLFLIIIWEFLHCFSGDANLKMMIAYLFIYLFFIILFFSRDMKAIDYCFIMRNFAVVVFGVCCILMLRLLIHNNFNLDMAFWDMRRLGQRDEDIGGMVINPNTLGVLCVWATGCFIHIRTAGEKNIFDLFLMVSVLVLGALTGSRTYLACLLILGLYIFVVSDSGMKGKIKLLFGSIIVLIVSLLLLYLLFPATLDMFIQRFNVMDITSGRKDLFIAYNDYLFSSAKALFWGLGALGLADKVMQISFNVPHNGIQEILVAWGIIGLLLFIAMNVVLIRRSRQENPNQAWMNYALLIVLLAKIMVGQVITSSYTMLSFALIYLSLCHDFTRKKDLKKLVYK